MCIGAPNWLLSGKTKPRKRPGGWGLPQPNFAKSDGASASHPGARNELVRQIRAWEADVVITHRPWDYHPDHRYTGQLVQDSAYLVMVPFVCPDAKAAAAQSGVSYLEDPFRLPVPFIADIAVNIDDVWHTRSMPWTRTRHSCTNGCRGSRRQDVPRDQRRGVG